MDVAIFDCMIGFLCVVCVESFYEINRFVKIIFEKAHFRHLNGAFSLIIAH